MFWSKDTVQSKFYLGWKRLLEVVVRIHRDSLYAYGPGYIWHFNPVLCSPQHHPPSLVYQMPGAGQAYGEREK